MLGNILWEVVQSKINRFLDLADRYGMTVMVAFQPDYMRVEDADGPQIPQVCFHPGRHENHWRYLPTVHSAPFSKEKT